MKAQNMISNFQQQTNNSIINNCSTSLNKFKIRDLRPSTPQKQIGVQFSTLHLTISLIQTPFCIIFLNSMKCEWSYILDLRSVDQDLSLNRSHDILSANFNFLFYNFIKKTMGEDDLPGS